MPEEASAAAARVASAFADPVPVVDDHPKPTPPAPATATTSAGPAEDGIAARRWPRLTRGRIVRLAFGVGFLVTGIAAAIPHLISTISTAAIINARVVPVISPIRDTVRVVPPVPGSVVKIGAILARVEDRQVDGMGLETLRTEHAGLKERIAAQKQVLRDLDTLDGRLEVQRSEYQQTAVTRLGHRLAEARAALNAAVATRDQRNRILSRRGVLHKKGIISKAAIEDARAQAVTAREEAKQHRAGVSGLRAQLAAARRGVFTESGSNDVPYSQQRKDEIALRRVEVTAQIREHEIRTRELERSITNESDRFRARAAAEIRSPIRGIVYRHFANPGATVVPNEHVAALIDCSRLVINVSLDQIHFERIQTGDIAEVRSVGGSEVLAARVGALRGMSASTQGDSLVTGIPRIRNDQFLVTLAMDGSRFVGRGDDYCHVGRNAEVRFTQGGGLVGWARQLFRHGWMGRSPSDVRMAPTLAPTRGPAGGRVAG